jgi:phosphotriesterase-related protein
MQRRSLLIAMMGLLAAGVGNSCGSPASTPQEPPSPPEKGALTSEKESTTMPQLITTLGSRSAEEVGLILPHEHVFVDLRTGQPPGYAQAEPADVVRLMGPELERARDAGIGAIVEATPAGVGRRVDLILAVSRATGYPIIVPTGIYREPWAPAWAHQASEDGLRDWMLRELTEGIESSGVRAGWIKLSAGDNGITAVESRILKAAARAAAQTNAVIGSHTVRGRVVQDQLALLEEAGYTPSRFIWIHAQNEPDLDLHIALARRGVWIEYDGIGSSSDQRYLDLIRRLLNAGLGGQILLSHDRGWYDPAQPGGGVPKPYTYISEIFLPLLRGAGIDEATIARLTRENPFRAFAR